MSDWQRQMLCPVLINSLGSWMLCFLRLGESRFILFIGGVVREENSLTLHAEHILTKCYSSFFLFFFFLQEVCVEGCHGVSIPGLYILYDVQRLIASRYEEPTQHPSWF